MSETKIDFGDNFRSAPERLREVPEQRKRLAGRTVKFEVTFLDDIAHGLLPTDFVVMSAVTGGGKTTMGSLFAEMNASAGRRVHYFALEAHRNEIEQRMLFRAISKLVFEAHEAGCDLPRGWGNWSYGAWVHGKCEEVSDRFEQIAVEILSKNLTQLRTFYRDRRFTAQDISRQFNAIRGQTDLIVFDHLHDVDSDDDNENRAMKEIVRTVSEMVTINETPVIAIAHLRKPDLRSARLVPDMSEFHGSSEIIKYATKVFIIAPARDQPSTLPGVSNTYMRVAKDRVVGTTSYTAVIGFDMIRNEYQERYMLGRLSFRGDEFEHLKPSEKPPWAKRGDCMGSEKPGEDE